MKFDFKVIPNSI